MLGNSLLKQLYGLDQGSPNHNCKQCGKVFGWASNLNEHMKKVHGLENKHILIKKEDPPKIFSCKYCKESFALFGSLQSHIYQKHADIADIVKCDICQTKFENEDSKKQHMAIIHEGVKNHVCNKCGKAFGWLSNLKEHQNLVHNDNHKSIRLRLQKNNQDRLVIPCLQCPKMFSSDNERMDHFDVIHNGLKKYKCDLCSASYGYKKNLTEHFKYKHSPEGVNNENIKRKSCPICKKIFHSKHLSTHIAVAHEGLRKYKCDQCEKSFKYRNSLIDHKLRIHEKDQAFIPCKICNKSIIKTGMRKHIRIKHEKKFNHKCHLCDKSYDRSTDLNEHIKIVHTGIRLKCRFCKLCYTKRSVLEAHVKNVHEGVRWQCQYCGKLLTTRANRNKHIGKVHKVEKKAVINPDEIVTKKLKYCCEFCGKAFSKMYNKKTHIKTVHGG